MANQMITLRIVGESGEGIVSTGEILSRILQQMGQELMTFRTYPAEIKGGQCLFQLRFSRHKLHTPGDDPEIVVCFDEKSYFEHGMAKNTGWLLYNSNDTAPENHPPGTAFGIPFTTLAREQGGALQAKNMVVLGALSYLMKLDRERVEAFARKWFAPKGESVVTSNTRAILAGWDFCRANFDEPAAELSSAQADETLMLSGNQALVLGALSAGCRFFAGYPITPASNILEMMVKELPKFGGIGIQTEDEIAALGAAIGASYAGKKAMTATSGPGLSLMHEMIGLAGMAEIPVVIVDAQRAGPSTGMPTKMEQGDLLAALHGSHGEAPRVVLAPSTVAECYSLTVTAFNISEALRLPVIILSDLALAQRTATIPAQLLENVRVVDRAILEANPAAAFLPYAASETGVNVMTLPGTPGAMHVITGLEHDAAGAPNYAGENHTQMNEKRHRKLALAFQHHPGYEEFHAETSAAIGVIGWGSTQGPILEALERLREQGMRVPLLQLKLLHPLPEQAIRRFADQVERIVVIEHNYTGQLAGLIQAMLSKPVLRWHKIQGVPFTVKELVEKLVSLLEHKTVEDAA